MRQDYVIYKGKRYNSGDKIDIMWYTEGYKNERPYTGTFLDCDEEKDEYRFIADGETYHFNKVCFYRTMRGNVLSSKSEQHKSKAKKELTIEKELKIAGMLNAWIWYILIMVVCTIFKDRVLFWATASIIFFKYRNRKLIEAGYK